MRQVKECGAYCDECRLFIKDDDLPKWECWCMAENWHHAKIVLETEGKFIKESK